MLDAKLALLGAAAVGVAALSGGKKAAEVKAQKPAQGAGAAPSGGQAPKPAPKPATGGTGPALGGVGAWLGDMLGTAPLPVFTLPTTPKPTTPAPKPTTPAPKPTTPAPGPQYGPFTPAMGGGTIPAGPIFNANRPAIVDRVNIGALQQFIAARTSWLSPLAVAEMSRALSTVAAEEKYPLDLLLGHCYAENGLKNTMTANGAGAVGPLQVTKTACQQVGMPYPPRSVEDAVRTGVRYMKWLRRTYPEAKSSLTACLRMYGMGAGAYRTWIKGGKCRPCAQESSSVAKAECGCNGGRLNDYTQKVHTVAVQAAAFHTRDWDAW